jgi:hypothetical protein
VLWDYFTKLSNSLGCAVPSAETNDSRSMNNVISMRNLEIWCGDTTSKNIKAKKAVPLHAMEVLGGTGGIAPTHSRPRH